MNNVVIDFLIKCSEYYYNKGSNYISNIEEQLDIENDLEIHIFNDQPTEITDEIYDKIYDWAKNKYAWHPFFGMVGANVSDEYGKEIEFINPMGSMTELKEGDWDKWKTDKVYLASAKLDGLSVKLFYKNGVLVQAASRGDGYKGKDITRHILHITNIPKSISYKEDCEIRGELICPIINISDMINDLKEETGKEYKNGRNTIAGFLNSKNTLLSVAKYAKFIAFDTNIECETEVDKFRLLDRLLFDVPAYNIVSNQTEDDLIEMVKYVKANNEYECDGIIITLNEPNKNYEGFETGTINPKKSRKFKLGATNNSAETYVKDIIWNVSKDGKLIPTIEIEPINVVGVTIKYVTGHNYLNLIKNHIGVGAKILVVRSGDVIPYIKEVLEPTDGLISLYKFPDVETFVNGVDLELLNKEIINPYTTQMMIQKLVFFCKSLEIDYIGEGNCKTLMEDYLDNRGKFMTPLDLIQENRTYLYNFLGEVGIKIYESMKSRLENSTEVDYMAALGVFGENMGKRILNMVYEKYHTLNVTESQLKMVNNFGDVRISNYIQSLDKYHETIKKLKSIGISFKIMENNIVSDKYSNYIVCFTGVRDALLSKFIRENGGVATDSWNKNVNLLICKDPNSVSGKITKAREKGIKCVSLEEAKEIFK